MFVVICTAAYPTKQRPLTRYQVAEYATREEATAEAQRKQRASERDDNRKSFTVEEL